jgi:hypothetical protein
MSYLTIRFCYHCGGPLVLLRQRLNRLGVEPKLRQCWACRGLCDAQTDFIGGDVIAAHQSEIPNARAPGEFDPLAILELIQRESLHPLAQRQIFAETDYVEGDGLANRQHQFRRGDVIVGGPVGVARVVQSPRQDVIRVVA